MPKLCGFDKHLLKKGVLVTDPMYLPFIHKTRPDFRLVDEVCRICRNSMEYMFRVKKHNAQELQKSRISKVSTISSNSADSIDSFDRLVLQTPQHKKPREKGVVSSTSINTDQSGLAIFGGPNTQSPIGTNAESYIEKRATNILQQRRRQSLNDSHKKPGQQINNKTKTDILQENLSVLSVSTSESENLSLDTVIWKKVTFNIVSTPKSASSRIGLTNRGSDIAFSPTIYYYEPSTSAAAPKAKGIVEKQYTAVPVVTPKPSDRINLNVRLSQEPSTTAAASKAKGMHITSAKVGTSKPTDRNSLYVGLSQMPSTSSAAAKAKGIVQKQITAVPILTPKSADRNSLNVRLSKESSTSAAAATKQSTAVQIVKPKSRGIKDYFAGLEGNGTSTNNSSHSETSTASNIIRRTEQTSASSRKRLLNGNEDRRGDADGDNDDDEPRMSLNYFNPEVRYPQYQPIPKRHKNQHKNQQIMDIYIKGIIGG